MGGMKLGIFGGLAFFVLTLVFTNIAMENNRAVRATQDQIFGIGQGQVQPQEQAQRVVQPAQPVENVNKDNNETKQEVQQVQVQPQGQGLTKMQKFNQDFSSFDKKFEGFDEEFSR
ncbi:MAG: hypothetical protein IBX45_13490, partial [Campylobacterales bacterium]|nr:hypothetical protein [Campylobacterales bacterium]